MPHPSKTPARRAALTIALTAALLPMPTIAKPTKAKPADAANNRGVESVHQPIVTRTDYMFDARAEGTGLPTEEQGRLTGWFDAMNLGYGDRVAVVDGDAANARVREDLATLLGRYGLLLTKQAPATAGRSAAGHVRIVISRATAELPGCPNWSDRNENDYNNRTGSNYGCAVNSNLAQMVADPMDLVEGRASSSDLRMTLGIRAIRAYLDKASTSTGELKTEKPGGGK